MFLWKHLLFQTIASDLPLRWNSRVEVQRGTRSTVLRVRNPTRLCKVNTQRGWGWAVVRWIDVTDRQIDETDEKQMMD